VVQLVAGKLAEMYGARGQKLDIVSLKDMPKDFEGLHEWALQHRPTEPMATSTVPRYSGISGRNLGSFNVM